VTAEAAMEEAVMEDHDQEAVMEAQGQNGVTGQFLVDKLHEVTATIPVGEGGAKKEEEDGKRPAPPRRSRGAGETRRIRGTTPRRLKLLQIMILPLVTRC